MARGRELTEVEMELYNYIMEFVVGNGVTLDGFNQITNLIKKEYSQRIIL